MNFSELIYPMTRKTFYEKVKGKRYHVWKSKNNRFKNYFSWTELDNYLNQINIGAWDRTPQLQIIMPDGNKWCKKKSPDKKSREEILQLWNKGCTFVLTLSEFLNENLWRQCQEFEREYGVGQANLYCSKKADAHCFPTHADSTDNFLFHVRGDVEWYIYNEYAEGKDGVRYRSEDATLNSKFTLSPGDLLYIPKKLYHRVTTTGPRISISFHFRERGEKPYLRNDWYDWKP